MTVAELREALADVQLDRSTVYNTPWEIIEETARSWLRILEGDEQLVEKVAKAIYDCDLPAASFNKQGNVVPFAKSMTPKAFRNAARAVLAAITEEER